MQYLKVFKYLVQYLVFKYYLNTTKCEAFHKVFKYSGQSLCPNTVKGLICYSSYELHGKPENLINITDYSNVNVNYQAIY